LNQGRPNCVISSRQSSSSKIKSRVSSESFIEDPTDLAESEARVDELKAEIATLAQKLAEQDAQGHELARINAKIRKNEDRYLFKRQTLSTRKDEYTNAIRDLGILPEEAYTKYVDASLDKVCLKILICVRKS
jgi:structural maintenance of chromosome 3 (chondroitin sulfate proteoglycan 6)